MSDFPSTPAAPAPYRPGVGADDLQLMLARTAPQVWDALRGQRLFVTGGTGFIGTWLLEGLLWADQALDLRLAITVLSRNPAAFEARTPHLARHPAVTLETGNTRDLSRFGGSFDTVLHMATDVVHPAADPVEVFDDIVDGTKQALALAQRCGARRFMLTSSGAVYGPQPPGMTHVPEDYKGAPDLTATGSAYGQGKRVAEWLTHCQRERHGLQTQITRIYALGGPYLPLDAQFAMGNFVNDCLHKRPITISGDGTPHRSYLYAADLVVWLLTILVRGDGHAYNVGSSEAISIADLARRVARRLGGNDIRILQAPVPGRAPAYYVPDTSRAAALGLAPTRSLDESIARTAAWYGFTLENS